MIMAFSNESEKIFNLLSNAQPNLFPSNRANDFTNRLPPLNVPHGDLWEVGLKEFACVNTLQTIPQDLSFYTTRQQAVKATSSHENKKGDSKTKSPEKGELKTKSIPETASKLDETLTSEINCQMCNYILPKGYYTISSLIKALNQDTTAFEFSSDPITEKIVKIKVQTKDVSLQLSPTLSAILGLPQHIQKRSKIQGIVPINLKAFTYNIIIYSDIVAESIVGGQHEKILRIIPFEPGEFQEVFHREFLNVDYLPVTRDRIDDIHIRLMTDAGEPIPFVDGRVFLKLHFRRKYSK